MRTLKRKEIKAYKEERAKKRGNYCPITFVELKASNAVLDHSHSDGRCREVIDRNLNQFLGKIESNYKRFLEYKKEPYNLPTILSRLASYLLKDFSNNPYHPGWADLQVRKFSRLNKLTQYAMLIHRGIKPGKTSRDRTKQMKQWFYEV